MVGKSKTPELSAADIITYLKAHPDFLDKNPEVLGFLIPPDFHDGDGNIVDMQRYMVERLRGQIDELQGQFRDLIFSARDNMTAQDQVHQAILQLLACETLDELMHVVSTDLEQIFGVDVIRLCLEVDLPPRGEADYNDIQFVPRGTVARLIPPNMKVFLGAGNDAPVEDVFGSAAPLAASYALARVEGKGLTHQGVIAFGVRDAEQFHPGQGTELLHFLSHILAFCVARVWPQNQNNLGNSEHSHGSPEAR